MEEGKIELEYVRVEVCGEKNIPHMVLICSKNESVKEKQFCNSFFNDETNALIKVNKIVFDDTEKKVKFIHYKFGEAIVDCDGIGHNAKKITYEGIKKLLTTHPRFRGYGSSTWGGQLHILVNKC